MLRATPRSPSSSRRSARRPRIASPPPPGRQAVLDAGLLRSGSPGHSVDPGLLAPGANIILQPFPGLSAFTNAELLETLMRRGLHRVIVAGARTDVEVDSTARDAIEAGLHATVVSDCCTGTTPDRHRAAVEVTLPRLVHAVLTLDELREFGIAASGTSSA